MARSASVGGVILAMLALAGAAAAQPTSHMMQQPADHAVLLGDLPVPLSSTCIFRRIQPTTMPGDRIPTFTIPEGRLLVITDVEWEAEGQWDFAPNGLVPFAPNSVVEFRLVLVRSDPFAELTVMQSRTVTSGPQHQPVAGSEQLTTGVVLAPGVTFCGRTEALGLHQGNPNVVVRQAAKLGRVLLRGYLIDAT